MDIGYGLNQGKLSKSDEIEIYNTLHNSLDSVLERLRQNSKIIFKESRKEDESLYSMVIVTDIEVEDESILKVVLAELDTNVYLQLYPFDVDYYLTVDRKVLKELTGLFARAKAEASDDKNSVKALQSQINEILEKYELI